MFENDQGRENFPDFNQNHDQNTGWAFLLWAIPLVLSICGIMMIASLSMRNNIGFSMPIRQTAYLFIGVITMFFMTLIPLKLLRNISGYLWFVAVVLVGLTLIPQIGIEVGGARRWLSLGFMRFQPLEFLMFALPLFLANRINASEVRLRSDREAFLHPTLMITIASCALLAPQHLGGTMLVAAVCLMMHAENRGWKYPGWSIVLVAFSLAGLILITPYRMRRVQSFIDPWNDPQDKGYQIIQGLIAFANGGKYGLGIGKGLQEARYLPAAQTDYIFAAIGEEFGLAGTSFLLILYAVWTFRVYKMYKGLNNPFFSCLTVGMTASIICPMFLNMAGVMHLLPLTGVPMPFLSAGGSSMLFMWAKVGILIAISDYSPVPSKSLILQPLPSPEDIRDNRMRRRRRSLNPNASEKRIPLVPPKAAPTRPGTPSVHPSRPSSQRRTFDQQSGPKPNDSANSVYRNYRRTGIRSNRRPDNRTGRNGRNA